MTAPAIYITQAPYNAVSDGTTNNRAAIQAALNAAGAALAYTEVVVPPGDFAYSGVLIISNTTLSGLGELSILRALDPANEAVQLIGNNSGLAGLKIIGNVTTPTATPQAATVWAHGVRNFAISNVHIAGSADAAILVDSASSQGSIVFNTIETPLAGGIKITGVSHHLSVSGNRVTGCGGDGIAVLSYVADAGYCHDITIQSNTILAQAVAYDIAVLGGSTILIGGNHTEGGAAGAAGIYVASETESATAACSGISVVGNSVLDGGGTGHGAITLYNSQAAMVMSAIIVQGNSIKVPRGAGVQLVGSYKIDVDVSGNTVYSLTSAFLDNSNSAAVATVAGNSVLSPSTYPGDLASPGGGAGTGSSPSVAPPAASAAVLAQQIVITDFGAVPDGGSNNPTDNLRSIQAALNAAVGTSRTVVIPPGIFAVRGVLSVLGVKLLGSGDTSILRALDPLGQGITVTGFSASLESFFIQGISAGASAAFAASSVLINGATGAQILNVHIAQPSGHGIEIVGGSTSCNVTGCTIEWPEDGGILIGGGSSHIVVAGNLIAYAGAASIAVYSGPTDAMASNITISGNTILAPIDGPGIALLGVSTAAVSGNHIEGGLADLAGIYLAAEAESNQTSSVGVTISGNSIIDGGGAVSGEGALTVYNSMPGQTITSLTISGNEIVAPRAGGILIQGSQTITATFTDNDTYTDRPTLDFQRNNPELTIVSATNNDTVPVSAFGTPIVPAGGGVGTGAYAGLPVTPIALHAIIPHVVAPAPGFMPAAGIANPALLPRPAFYITDAPYNAVGDGVTDNAAALNAAFAAGARLGQVVGIPVGRFAYGATLAAAAVTIVGAGSSSALLAIHPDVAALVVDGLNPRISNFSLIGNVSAGRLAAPLSAAVYVAPTCSGYEIDNMTIRGGASAGIFQDGSQNGFVHSNTITGTLAGGIYHVNGAAGIRTTGNRIVFPGDDGISIISTTVLCQRIAISGNSILYPENGRGIAHLGGIKNTIIGNHLEGGDTLCAGIYVATESETATLGVDALTIAGNTLIGCGGATGAISLYNSNPGSQWMSNIHISGNQIVAPPTCGFAFAGAGYIGADLAGNQIFSDSISFRIDSGSNEAIVDNGGNAVLASASYPGPLVGPVGGVGT